MACRAASCESTQGTPSWVSRDGGADLGRRIRAGEVEGISHHVFRSTVLRRDVGLVVATPPGYQTRTADRYPVVYMFPGIGGDEWAYLLEVGLEGPTLKALFANPETAPIVVFCNPGSSGAHGPAERVLSEELVSFVDHAYRTRAQASARSLEGFSLGGVTALTLFLRRADVFARVAAGSSACYLLPTCGALRAELTARAKASLGSHVLLSVGSRESAENAAVNDEMAALFGTPAIRVPGAQHDWGVQLKTPVNGTEFGKLLADFHLAGFRP
ncbi:MAG: hypothetical protein RLZZ450_7235 [Pseudomonadota bacterium]